MQLPVNGDADDIGPFLIQQIPEPNISMSCTNEVILGMYICVVYDIGPNQWYFRLHSGLMEIQFVVLDHF